MSQPLRIAIQLELEWPYNHHAAMFAGTQQYAYEQGWHSIIDEFVAQNLLARPAARVHYDGIIARSSKNLARCSSQLGVPLVNVWFNSPARDQLPGVFPDYSAIGRLRAEHLLARGLRRFAILVREDRGRHLEAAAFRSTVEAAGFPCSHTKIPLNPARSHAVWLKAQQRIDAWMCDWQLPVGVSVNDEALGRTIVQMCVQRGWRVPQDVAIIAGANEKVLCENPRPSLSSTDLGFERIGYEAARLLDGLMEGKKKQRRSSKNKPAPTHIMLPPKGIVIRESTDFYAVDDEIVAAALLFIARKSNKQVSPSDVAQAVGLEPRTLRRRFAKVLGRTVVSEIRRVRVERAKRELVQSKRSLAAIARDVGFVTRRQMCEVFFRELGVTPREFRKRRQLLKANSAQPFHKDTTHGKNGIVDTLKDVGGWP